MAKSKQFDDAIVMALLQDIDSALFGGDYKSSASTGIIAMSDIKRNGADKQDIENVVLNDLFDKQNDVFSKIKSNLLSHPELAEKLDKIADDNDLLQEPSEDVEESLYDLRDLFLIYLNDGVQSFRPGGQFEEDSDFVQVKIGNKEYNLLYLSTRKEMEIGLSGVEEMEDNEGALFDYSDKPQKELSFWMKDTTIPLKICFINKDGMVISVHNGKPLSEESMFEDSEPIYYVIEVKQSENITKGMKTDLMEEDVDEDENVPDEHPELNVNKLYIYGSDGNVQGIIHSGCRIFSRKSTKVIIRKAKRAFASKEDKDYKALGRYVFNEIKAQDNRPEEYVS